MNKIINRIFWVIGLLSFYDISFLNSLSGSLQQYDPISFLKPNRVDLAAKYIYAKSRELGVKSSWPTKVYSEHIKVWVNFVEPKRLSTDPDKKGRQTYIKTFNHILDSVKKEGFDAQRSVVRIGGNGSLLNGAHRATACLLYGKQLTGICETHSVPRVTFDYFKNRTRHVQAGLRDEYLDAMALQYTELKKNVRLMISFSLDEQQQARKVFIPTDKGTLIYRKIVNLTEQGIKNLQQDIFEIQMHRNDNLLKNSSSKMEGVASSNYPVCICLFEQNENAEFESWEIEDGYVTKSYEETMELVQTFFNQNSIHFINHATPQCFRNLQYYVPFYKKFLKDNGYNSECFCVDSSAVMAAYGIRDCDDLDFLHHGYDFLSKDCVNGNILHSHNNHSKHHGLTIDEIIFNPSYHFYFRGLKFASLDQILRMKQRRNSLKDKKDVLLIKDFLSKNKD